MSSYNVYDMNKEVVGSIEIPYFDVPMNEYIVQETVRNYLANQRQGTHSTKTKAEVRGGGKKPWAQKHTGKARQGSIRNPHWRGGGVAFGPKPRDYSYAIPKNIKKNAFKAVFSDKLKNNAVYIINSFNIEAPKTQKVATLLEKFSSSDALIIDVNNQNLYLSTRNSAFATYMDQSLVNVYQLLNHKAIFISAKAIELLGER